MSDPVRELARKDGRFSPEAFRFLFESLEVAIRVAGKEEAQGTERHVTGKQVLEGLRQNAVATFGPLAADVWRAWGVRDTLDWGRIVFLLVDAGLLNRQESDTIDEFRDGFDFDDGLGGSYEPSLSSLPDEAEGG